MKSNFTKKITFGIFLILGTLFSSNISYSQCPTAANAVRNSTDITCNGLTDGTITVEITDGTPPFNFELFDNNIGSFVTLSVSRVVSGDGRTVVFSNVYSSSFQVVVFKSGCPTIQITDGPFGFVIEEPALLEASIVSVTDDCDNLGSGTIDIDAVGGTTPYTYLWSNGETTQDVTNLDAGTYSVQVSDANNCTFDLTGIVVNEGPDAGIALPGNGEACTTDNAYDLFSLLDGTQDAGGVWSILSGTGATVDGATGAVDFTVATAGIFTFRYTVSTPSCPDDLEDVTVEVFQAPTAGTGTDATICNTESAFDLDNQLAGADAGIWTKTGGTGAGEDNTNIGTGEIDFTSAVAGTYEYTYTVAATANCPEDTEVVIITVEEAPDAGTPADATVCNTEAAFNLDNQLTGADAGGIWTNLGTGTGSGDVLTGNLVDFTSAVAGTYIYEYEIPATATCPNAIAIVTITVEEAPTAGTGTDATICNTESAFDLDNQLAGADAGIWTKTGGTGAGEDNTNIGTGEIDFTSAVAGTYEYTYTVAATANCPEDTEVVIITVEEAPDAGTPADATVCNTEAAFNLDNQLTGADAGGIWTNLGTGTGSGDVLTGNLVDFTSAVAGTYIYEYEIPATATCPNAIAIVTITVEEAPTAGTGTDATICNTESAFDLDNQLAGADAGIWTKTGGTGAGEDNTNIGTGEIDFTSAVAGTYEYTYTVAATANCPEDTEVVIITVEEAPDAGTPADATVCNTEAAFNLDNQLTGADAGGIWTNLGTGTGSGDVLTGNLVDFTSAVAGTYIYEYEIPATATCPNAIAIVTITVEEAPTAGTGTDATICNTESAFDLDNQLAGADAGIWTKTGGTGAGEDNTNIGTGEIDFTSAVAGTYEYTYTVAATANCPEDTEVVIITVEEAPDAGTPADATVCNTEAAFNLDNQLTGADAGGIWTNLGTGTGSGDVLTGNLVDFTSAVAGTYIYEYEIPATATCPNAIAIVTITVEEAPTAGTGTDATICNTESAFDLDNQLAGADAGIWTKTGGTGAGEDNTNIGTGEIDFTSAVAGTYEYTYTVAATANCPEDTEVVIITVEETPDAGSDATAEVCDTADAFDLLAAKGDGDNDGVWNDLDGSGAVITNNLADFTSVVAGVYNFEYVVGTAPCTPDNAILTVTITEQLVAGSNDSTQICVETSSLDLLAVKGDGDNGGTWVDTDASGATITGNIADFTGIAPGFYQFTYQIGAAPCAEESAILVVEILAEPDAGADATANVCNNNDAFDLLAAKGDGDDGGLWNDTDASGAVISGNLADFTGVPAGVYDFTYIIDNGFCAPSFATLTVTVGELVVNTDLVQPANCGENGTITLDIVTGNGDMIVWLDADNNIFDDGDGNNLVLSAPAGTYSVMVSDLTTTCVFQESFVITDPATFTVNATIADQTTCGVDNGSITLALTPPSATATFVWAGPSIDATNENNQDQANLAPGDYTVVITDGACTFTDTYTVAPAESITATAANSVLATCGLDDGTITVDVTQVGTNSYDIVINDSGNNLVDQALNQDGTLNPINFNGIGQGTYNVIVTDIVTNCEINFSVVVNEDAPFAIDNASITNITTCDAAEGAINLTLSGTSGAETITWTGPNGFTASTQNISGLADAGTYTVTIIDGGCTVTASYPIAEPADCDFDCTDFRVVPLTEAASCFGVQDGKIFFLLSNVSSNSPLKFSVKPAGAPDTDYVEYFVNNLGSGTIIEIPDDFLAGQYNVLAEDEAFACVSNVINVNVGTKTNITDNISVIQPTCEVATGTITVTLNGTADSFTFELYLQSDLDSLIVSNNDGVFGGLEQGIYAIKYVNANSNGCTLPDRQNIAIEDSNAFVATASDKEDVVCFGAETGSVIITLEGAASGFYSIDNGSTWLPFTSGNRISNLPAINNMLVSDEPGTSTCEVSLAVNILHLSAEIQLNGNISLITEASCTASEEIGEIRVPEVTGGVAPYIYFVDNQQVELSSDRTIGGLSRNVTNLIIIDNAGCIQSFDISAIVSPNEVRAIVTEINPENNCVNDPEGIEIIIDQNTVDNVPGPYGLIINKVNEIETTEFVLDINVNGSNTFIVGPGENLDFTFEKGVRYRWTIRSISNDQACSADNFITINGGAIIPAFTAEGVNVACFGESGAIILDNIVIDPSLPLIVELYERDSNSSPITFNIDELAPNGRFIINSNNTNRIERGNYEVRLVQLNLNCPTLLIASELLEVAIDAPTRQLQAELVPEPQLPPGVERSRSEMNPVPTTRPDRADGSISIRLTALTGATGYSARIFLLEPMGGNNTSQYDLPQQAVPFNSSQTVTFDNLLTGIYEIEYYDAFGCGLSGNRLIFGEDGTSELVVDFDRSPFIPNVFTPNDDGVNDLFEILNLPDNGAELIVTNRNGAIVYRNNSYRPSDLWDGGDQPDGIYFYQLRINDTVQNGWVEILRGKGR